mgnify:CR=1 FL=1
MNDETKIKRIIEAIEKVSFLPENTIRVLVVLLKHKAPLPVKAIAPLCKFSHQHACGVVRRMFKQKIILKAKTIHAVSYYEINKAWSNGILETYDNSSLYK